MTRFLVAALLTSAAFANTPPEIEAMRISTPPRIDGVIEAAWDSAPAATGFVQRDPDHGEPASEAVTAHILYDDQNLYVAFLCWSDDPGRIAAALSGVSDAVQLYLDTFDDDATAYAFSVRASGTENDYRVTQDGGWFEAWDGVWRSAVRLHPWGWAAELAIPFKSLRYPADLDQWGIDFGRSTVTSNERAYWSRHDVTGFRVSRMGALKGIRPGAQGLHLEVYPVALARAEQDAAVNFGQDPIVRFLPRAGLDLAWFPVPTTNLQLTTFPDYAQIEADPYQVNLSRYEQWLDERRPFFVEASETFGTGYQPLNLFYSRRIGKPLPDGQVVPVWGGAKVTSRAGRYSVGLLGATTGGVDYLDWYGNEAEEPRTVYTVASLREQANEHVGWGIIYTGKDNAVSSNHAVGLDAGLRVNEFTGTVFAAGSQSGDSTGSGYAANLGYDGARFTAYSVLQQLDSTFDVNGIGYTGWRGQSADFGFGPMVYNTGSIQTARIRLNGSFNRAWDDPGFSRGGGVDAYFDFRNRSSASAWANVANEWEQDSLYWAASAGGYAQTDYSKPLQLSVYGDFTTRAFNYRRWLFAPNATADVELSGRLGDHLEWELEAMSVFEFGPGYELEFDKDLTLVFRPGLTVTFTPKMNLGLHGEVVRGFDPSYQRRYQSYYGSLLYSWTFRPRSTFYVAFNQRMDNGSESGNVGLLGRVAVVKLRYLFVF